MSLPDFLIIGSPKAGSTALHVALAQHPDLFLSAPKEPKFFLCDQRKPDPGHQKGPGDAHSAQEWVWDRAAYENLFADAPAASLRGEIDTVLPVGQGFPSPDPGADPGR